MRELGLCDTLRELNPTKKDFTFFSHPHLIYSRLDYYFMYQRDMYRVTNCNIGTMDLSGHAPVYLNVTLDTEKKEDHLEPKYRDLGSNAGTNKNGHKTIF